MEDREEMDNWSQGISTNKSSASDLVKLQEQITQLV